MRYAGVLGTVALTELMAHFLSLSWGLMTLLAAFAWVALSGAAVAAKARSTEARVNALIPSVGAAHAAAAAAQSTANTANSNAGNAQSTANTANSNASNAQGTANSAQGTANSVASQVSGLSLHVGMPGGYPATGSPSNAGLGSYCNNICNQLASAGIF